MKILVVGIVALLLAVACSDDSPPAPSTSAIGGASTAISIKSGDPPVYAEALARYLTTWIDDGLFTAANMFAVAEQRPAGQTGAGGLVLRSAEIRSYQASKWVSPDEFTLLVSMDMHFDGTSQAYNEGSNARFVTFTRPAAGQPFLLSFASSPPPQ